MDCFPLSIPTVENAANTSGPPGDGGAAGDVLNDQPQFEDCHDAESNIPYFGEDSENTEDETFFFSPFQETNEYIEDSCSECSEEFDLVTTSNHFKNTSGENVGTVNTVCNDDVDKHDGDDANTDDDVAGNESGENGNTQQNTTKGSIESKNRKFYLRPPPKLLYELMNVNKCQCVDRK